MHQIVHCIAPHIPQKTPRRVNDTPKRPLNCGSLLRRELNEAPRGYVDGDLCRVDVRSFHDCANLGPAVGPSDRRRFVGYISMEMTIDELMQIARSKRWTVWTISMIPGTGQLVISGSPLCTPLVEKMYFIPGECLGEKGRLDDLLREMNRLGGWPPEVVRHQERLQSAARASLPAATVEYVGKA